MRNFPDTHELATLFAETHRAASRLVRRFGLAPVEREDIYQDLLTDLIRRLPAFDPDRGSLAAFADIILRNHACRKAHRIATERKMSTGALVSLDTGGPDGGALAEVVDVDDGLPVWHRGPSRIGAIDRRLDLNRAAGALTETERHLCRAALRVPVRVLADRGCGSRATLYRRMRDIRCTLLAAGFAAA